MKKIICIILGVMCTVGVVGCGSKESSTVNNVQSAKVVEESKDLNKDNDSSKTEEETKEKTESAKEEKVESKETAKSTSPSLSSESILTKNFSEVKSVEIIYKKSSKTYTIEKDKDFIKKIYDSILSTKTTVKNDRDESEPRFTVNIVYKSGSKDTIMSTETGQFIYRVFGSKKSRVCGTNTDLFNLVKDANK